LRQGEHMSLRRYRPLVAGLVCALAFLPGVGFVSPYRSDASAQLSAAAIAQYKKKLEEYEAARAAFEVVATPYWKSVAEKRRMRFAKRRNNEPIALDDYVLTQPPIYAGPPRPVDPSAPEEAPERPSVPVVADFLAAAKEVFEFVPQGPRSEIEYKRAYARIASAAGLTRDQAVRVYGFESGGNGEYDVQAGLEYSKNRRAISTAIGYNQLLTANTIDILSRKGAAWTKRLQAELPRRKGAAKEALAVRIAALKRMTAAARSVPYAGASMSNWAGSLKGSAFTRSTSTSISVRCCRPRSCLTRFCPPAPRAIRVR
jgi:hypothetical protein